MDTTKKMKFCPNCGKQNESLAKFCIECGYILEDKINVEIIENEDDVVKSKDNNHFIDDDNEFRNDIKDFTHKNSDYYIYKFENMKRFNNTVTWNWPAFFIGYLWFIYRKMYLAAAIIFFGLPIISLIPVIGFLVSLASPFLLGMFANKVYYEHMQKNIREVENLQGESKSVILRAKGGVNSWLPIVVGIAFVILIIIISTFTGSLYYMLY